MDPNTQSHLSGEQVLKDGGSREEPASAISQVRLVGPMHRNFSVQQVKKQDGSRIYLINKGRNLNIENSN